MLQKFALFFKEMRMFESSKTPSILVVGDVMLDHYVWGKCERISPEAPVQVVNVTRETIMPGGACNVMNNLKELGAHVHACGVVGGDETAEQIKNMLQEQAINTQGIFTEDQRKTTKKSRIMASHQQVVRVDHEHANPIDDISVAQIMHYVESHIDCFDVVLLSDYGKGVLRPDMTHSIITLAKQKGKKTLVDPKGRDYAKYRGAYLVTPNKKEAILASDVDISHDVSLQKAGEQLKKNYQFDAVVITLSEDGMAIFDEGMTKIPTVAREVYDVTGAGDTVLASIGFCVSHGYSLLESCTFANAAAAVVVGKLGSATATVQEIFEYQHGLHNTRSQEKIKTRDALMEILRIHRDKGHNVVVTNGCFDLLHRGHVQYLEEAKRCGDVLVLGLNSDESIKRLKGDSRPINSELDRAMVLAGLESVDYINVFSEDTPYALINAIQPDVLVKGGDYQGKEVVGSDLVREVRLVDVVKGQSTTAMIQKIYQSAMES
jgi:D-beta-D-heptose 7-phosphate kinase / D-beta-D-heptose 1-phosphate adenosyltransferase